MKLEPKVEQGATRNRRKLRHHNSSSVSGTIKQYFQDETLFLQVIACVCSVILLLYFGNRLANLFSAPTAGKSYESYNEIQGQKHPNNFCPAGIDKCVVGGSTSLKGRYPYAVNLAFNERMPHCGGSLIAKDIVLTAGHCVVFDDVLRAPDLVYIGRFDLTSKAEIKQLNSEMHRVKSVFVHPGFDLSRLANDIAILHLSTSSRLPPVALSKTDINNKKSTLRDLTVIGWGVVTALFPFPSPVLMEADLSFISYEQCRARWSEFFKQNPDTSKAKDIEELISFDKETLVCAGGFGTRAPCFGDSGGPLILKHPSGKDVQVGVTSYVPHGCTHDTVPSVYTSASGSKSWIEHVVRTESIHYSTLNFVDIFAALDENSVQGDNSAVGATIGKLIIVGGVIGGFLYIWQPSINITTEEGPEDDHTDGGSVISQVERPKNRWSPLIDVISKENQQFLSDKFSDVAQSLRFSTLHKELKPVDAEPQQEEETEEDISEALKNEAQGTQEELELQQATAIRSHEDI